MKDEAGFRALFEDEYPRLVGELRVILCDGPLAEDVAADAFEQLARRWTRIRHYERPGAWVRLVAMRSATKARRRTSRRAAVESAWRPPDPLSPLSVDLQRALEGLPLQQRAAVVLHYLGGFTSPEVAEMLGCGDATVRTHLLRARQRLGVVLAEDEEVVDADS